MTEAVGDTPLACHLKSLIAADGPLTLASFMSLALGHPIHGYYATRDPLGAAGDFTTAPEISQMFGEIVGAWVFEAWLRAGSPSPVRLVELGPGRGTLMADMLRVLARAPDLLAAASLHLVETSPALRAAQAKTLARVPLVPDWRRAFEEVPDGPLLLVANEFFDCLPVRQFVRGPGGWRERVVGIEDGRLAFGLVPAVLADAPETAPEGAVVERSPAAETLMTEIAARIVAEGGAALVIDYGYGEEGPETGGTFQAVKAHAFADPLAAPGEADLTAHVDFAALTRAAQAAGAAAHGPMPQGAFLVALGLLERAGRLGAPLEEPRRESLRAAVERLAGERGMGRLFKALAVSRPSVALPPFAAS